jgi:hypothetical protein
MTPNLLDDDWVPEACALPTTERPLRRAEFDDLFVSDVLSVVRDSPHRLRLELRADPEVAARAASLAALETDCCSFFSFDLSIADSAVSLVIEAAPRHVEVMAALGARAEAGVAAA